MRDKQPLPDRGFFRFGSASPGKGIAGGAPAVLRARRDAETIGQPDGIEDHGVLRDAPSSSETRLLACLPFAYDFGRDLPLYRFVHSCRILSRFFASHAKSFLMSRFS